MVLSEIFHKRQAYMKLKDLAQRPRIETLGLGNRDLEPCSGHLTPLSIEKGGGRGL